VSEWDAFPLVNRPSAQPRAEPAATGWDAFPLAGSQSAARITAQPQQRPEPTMSPIQQMEGQHRNLLSAASQRATPNISALSKNFISKDVFEGDDGSIQFRDPTTGAIIPTDNTKHIVMRDPSDNTPKVYGRTASTTEGPLVGAARVLAPGYLTGAPTTANVVSRRVATIPTVDQLKGAAGAGYKSNAVTGLTVAPQDFSAVLDRVKSELTTGGMSSPVAKTTWELLEQAQNAPPGAIQTGQNIQALRASLSNAAKTPGTSDGKAAMTAKGIIDEMLPGMRAIDGDPGAAAAALKTADQNWSAAKDAEMLADKTYRAELRAASANSGMNVGNTTRQRLTDILTTPALRRGLTEEQITLAERIVNGNKPENAMRMIGNALGGGGGGAAMLSGAAGGTAAAISTGDPKAFFYGAALPLGGLALRSIGNKITLNQADKLAKLLRSDSPLGKQMANPVKDWEDAVRVFSQSKGAERSRGFAKLNIASRNLANNLRDAGINVSPGELLRSIQGSTKGRAEDEQN
jgi:hypothetical protein